jgi:uroporphyrinogen III methyltransferase / synthase
MSPETAASLPLFDKLIVVASSPALCEKLVPGLRAMGASVTELRVITIRKMQDQSPVDAAIDRICDYEWIIFTSSYGVECFADRLEERGFARLEGQLHNVCAVGPGTAATLERRGFAVALCPDNFVAEGILEALQRRHGGLRNLAGRRILIPRAKEARDVLPRRLAEAGILVDVVPCYETIRGDIPDEQVEQLRSRRADLVIFTSSSAVNNFLSITGRESGLRFLGECPVAVLGPVTAEAVQAALRRPEIIPNENTVPSLLESIQSYFSLKS